MEWYYALLILVGAIAVLIVIGMPVALAFLTANILGTLIFMPNIFGMMQIIENSTDLVTKFTLVPVPLFILMGALFFHTGLARQVFDAFDRLLGRIPGRLSFLAVGGGTVFATLTGSSLANAAMLGSLLIPEMKERKYQPRMAIGPIMGVGGLAIIIPPSAIAVLLAGIAGVDVARLLIAGLVPGLGLALMFALVIAWQLWRDPSAAPAYAVERVTGRELARLLLIDTLPIFIIIVAVIGVIVFGIATPSEAAAFGVLGVLLAAALFGKLTVRAIVQSLRGTVLVGGVVFFIVMGSAVFSQLLAFSGASRGFLRWATALALDPLMVLALMLLVLLVLGTFMDQVSVLLITVPIFFPLAAALGFDPIWFALLTLIAVEIGLITPPFGLLLFVMKGQAPPGVTFLDVVKAGLPFLFCNLAMLVLIVMFPQLALALPSLL